MAVVSSGVDYSHARPNQAFFNRHGFTFVCRYLLDDARDGGKALKLPEAKQLTSWGIGICANYEYGIGDMLKGFNQGVADARVALRELILMGAPRRIVYFSCDTDVSISQIPQVLEYMRGAGTVLGKENVGVYGEYDLIEAAHRAGYKWLWQCYAWSRGLWSAHATVRQVKNGAFPGEYDADLNYAMTADIGQWKLGESAMDARQEALVTGKLNALLNMFVEGTSPTGTETSGGGIDRVYLFKHLDDDREAVKKVVTDQITALKTSIVEQVRVAIMEALDGLGMSDAQVDKIASQVIAAVNKPMSGTWTADTPV